jgi:hypothetical protein
MTYHIAQQHEYLGKRTWRWRTWIEASDEALDAVEQVTWYLHHTFDPSVVTSTERESNFALSRRSWGKFQIRAEVKTAHETIALREWLQLRYPESEGIVERGAPTKSIVERGAPAKSSADATRVFLSYGAEDDHLANRVRRALQERGFRVLSASETAAGMPVEAATRRMIRESDVVMGIVSSDYTSPFVIDELNTAVRSDKPTVALLDQHEASRPQGLDEVENRISLDFASGEAETAAADILEKFGPP